MLQSENWIFIYLTNRYHEVCLSVKLRIMCPCQARAFLVTWNEFGPFFQYSNDRVLKSRLSKQSFRWYQLDLHKSQFIIHRVAEPCLRMNMKDYINYVKMTNEKFNNSNAREKVAFFVTTKVFHEIIVTTCRTAYLHTVTAWQATVSTEMHMWKFRFLEQT